jgi:hypothetical protein
MYKLHQHIGFLLPIKHVAMTNARALADLQAPILRTTFNVQIVHGYAAFCSATCYKPFVGFFRAVEARSQTLPTISFEL